MKKKSSSIPRSLLAAALLTSASARLLALEQYDLIVMIQTQGLDALDGLPGLDARTELSTLIELIGRRGTNEPLAEQAEARIFARPDLQKVITDAIEIQPQEDITTEGRRADMFRLLARMRSDYSVRTLASYLDDTRDPKAVLPSDVLRSGPLCGWAENFLSEKKIPGSPSDTQEVVSSQVAIEQWKHWWQMNKDKYQK